MGIAGIQKEKKDRKRLHKSRETVPIKICAANSNRQARHCLKCFLWSRMLSFLSLSSFLSPDPQYTPFRCLETDLSELGFSVLRGSDLKTSSVSL